MERHTISQPAYLRPSFSTHPRCLRASVAWHSAQEKGSTGPALNSVSIQGESHAVQAWEETTPKSPWDS